MSTERRRCSRVPRTLSLVGKPPAPRLRFLHNELGGFPANTRPWHAIICCMRIPRFTILQLFLAATLIALLLGLFTSARREKPDDGVCHFAFSPDGNRLAVLFANGCVRVWQINSGRPRLVAQAFGERPRNMLEIEAMNFLDDQRILKVECAVDRGVTKVLKLDLRTQSVSEIMMCNTTLARTKDGQAAERERLFIGDFTTGDLFSYDLLNLQLLRRLPLSTPGSWPALALSASGTVLVATDDASTIHVFDAE